MIILLLGLSTLASCSEDDALVAPSGAIAGFAGLRDVDGARLSDQSGISIKLKGTTLTASSDTLGKWTLANVPAGIYDIELSKPGFATNYIRAYQFVGGGTAYITSIVDLVRSVRDTLVLRNFSFVPQYEYFYRDTLIQVDTGFVRPLDSNALPNRAFRIEGSVTFESDTQSSAPLYLQPYYTDLSIVPSTNYLVGAVRKGSNDITLSVQNLIQRGYPRGVPVEITFTTRAINTFYFEPSTRERLVTDPHTLLKIVATIPEE
ncbi:MAG TPA: carboxypeptidase-like regulatory domain-containing protein [Candidatus Kapabacteria bacterium]|nr:carboxypeptidase-like regulatory domain-containing protein [Candidatus Kapabacteria bacterium]